MGSALNGTACGRNRRSYMPHHLAEKILNSRPALEGERKQVAMLFADVKGSMELARRSWQSMVDS